MLEGWAWAATCMSCVICKLVVCALEGLLTRHGGRACILPASCARALLHLLRQLDGCQVLLMRGGEQRTGHLDINFAA